MKGLGSWERGNGEGVGGGEGGGGRDGFRRVGGRPWPCSAETTSYLLRWIIKHNGIKEKMPVRCAVRSQEHARWASEN